VSKDFLVEIGTEELPPKVLRQLSEAFAIGITQRLVDQQLSFSQMTAYAAPRRLAVLITDLDEQTPDQDIVSWGPPLKVAFDAEGQPTKAAEAFAKKNGLEIGSLTELVENDGQQDKLCVRQSIAGSSTETLLGETINQSLAALPIPKPMRWGRSRQEFVRPVQWAVVLFGNHTVAIDILGVTSGNLSRGHRFHSSSDIKITSPSDYRDALYDAFVMVDFAESPH
jgi:glycyl-tRNA synthetase beta chain